MLSTVGVGFNEATSYVAHNETAGAAAYCSQGDQAISGGFEFLSGGFRAHVLSSKRVIDGAREGWSVSYRLEDPAHANVPDPENYRHAVTLGVEVYCAVG